MLSVGKKRKDKSAQVKDLVKHALSQELQIYYDKITTAVLGVCAAYSDCQLFDALIILSYAGCPSQIDQRRVTFRCAAEGPCSVLMLFTCRTLRSTATLR